jgi:hypothetical protein
MIGVQKKEIENKANEAFKAIEEEKMKKNNDWLENFQKERTFTLSLDDEEDDDDKNKKVVLPKLQE